MHHEAQSPAGSDLEGEDGNAVFADRCEPLYGLD